MPSFAVSRTYYFFFFFFLFFFVPAVAYCLCALALQAVRLALFLLRGMP